MGLKKYIFASIVLIVALLGYTFSLESGDYRLVIFDNAFVLPVALLVTLPVAFLFLASLLHMIFYNFKNYLAKRALNKDENNIIELIKDVMLYKKSNKVFKSKELKEIANIIAQMKLEPHKDFKSENSELNEIAHTIKKLHDNEYLPPKELKLDNENPLMIHNNMNRVAHDDDFALEVIRKPDSYTQEILQKAHLKIVNQKSITTIKKNLEHMSLDNELVKKIIKKDAKQQKEFSLSSDEIIHLLSRVNFTTQDYIELVKIYKATMLPDKLIKILEDLSSNNDDATEAYLFVLFEFEMVDNIREILSNSSKDEYLPYRALLDLKDAGKHYSLESLCYCNS